MNQSDIALDWCSVILTPTDRWQQFMNEKSVNEIELIV